MSSDSIKLVLAPNETGLVAGMQVTNTGTAPAELEITGEGPVLHEQQVIDEKDAITPALRMYYAIMNIYKEPATFADQYRPFLAMAKEMVKQVPSTGPFIAEIGDNLLDGHFRRALDSCMDLLAYEDALMKQLAEAGEPDPKKSVE
ncbi:MAG: flagellar biosynthesis repressor FlbT [Magnetospiraceae bacterium]